MITQDNSLWDEESDIGKILDASEISEDTIAISKALDRFWCQQAHNNFAAIVLDRNKDIGLDDLVFSSLDWFAFPQVLFTCDYIIMLAENLVVGPVWCLMEGTQ